MWLLSIQQNVYENVALKRQTFFSVLNVLIIYKFELSSVENLLLSNVIEYIKELITFFSHHVI